VRYLYRRARRFRQHQILSGGRLLCRVESCPPSVRRVPLHAACPDSHIGVGRAALFTPNPFRAIFGAGQPLTADRRPLTAAPCRLRTCTSPILPRLPWRALWGTPMTRPVHLHYSLTGNFTGTRQIDSNARSILEAGFSQPSGISILFRPLTSTIVAKTPQNVKQAPRLQWVTHMLLVNNPDKIWGKNGGLGGCRTAHCGASAMRWWARLIIQSSKKWATSPHPRCNG
jgi:hypothetical protein